MKELIKTYGMIIVDELRLLIRIKMEESGMLTVYEMSDSMISMAIK